MAHGLRGDAQRAWACSLKGESVWRVARPLVAASLHPSSLWEEPKRPPVCHPPSVMRLWAGCGGGKVWRPQHGPFLRAAPAVAVPSVPQRAVLGVIRELEAGAAVGLQARRRTLALRRLRVVPVVAPADALSEEREVARRAIRLEHVEARERGLPLGVGQRTTGERLAARVPIVLDCAPSVSAARCGRRAAHCFASVAPAAPCQLIRSKRTTTRA